MQTTLLLFKTVIKNWAEVIDWDSAKRLWSV